MRYLVDATIIAGVILSALGSICLSVGVFGTEGKARVRQFFAIILAAIPIGLLTGLLSQIELSEGIPQWEIPAELRNQGIPTGLLTTIPWEEGVIAGLTSGFLMAGIVVVLMMLNPDTRKFIILFFGGLGGAWLVISTVVVILGEIVTKNPVLPTIVESSFILIQGLIIVVVTALASSLSEKRLISVGVFILLLGAALLLVSPILDLFNIRAS